MKKTCSLALLVDFLVIPSLTAFVPGSHIRNSRDITVVNSLFRELDDLFDDPFFTDPLFGRRECRSMIPSSSLLEKMSIPSDMLRRSSPRYDITENEDEFKISLDVPGVKAEDIKVEVLPAYHAIRMTGSRKEGSFSSYFEKSFHFGKDIDTSGGFKATVSDGVLLVTLPKNPKLKESFQIPVLAVDPRSTTTKSKELKEVPIETAVDIPPPTSNKDEIIDANMMINEKEEQVTPEPDDEVRIFSMGAAKEEKKDEKQNEDLLPGEPENEETIHLL